MFERSHRDRVIVRCKAHLKKPFPEIISTMRPGSIPVGTTFNQALGIDVEEDPAHVDSATGLESFPIEDARMSGQQVSLRRGSWQMRK